MLSIIECNNIKIWNDFLEKEKKNQVVTIAHNPCLGAILSKTFGYTYKNYLIKRDDEIVGVLPTVSIGSKIVSMPHFSYGGPILKVGHDNNFDLSSVLNNSKYEVRSFSKLSSFRNDKKISFVVPLNKPVNEMFMSYTSKMRNKIKKSEKLGFTVTKNGPNALDHFYTLFSKKMLQKGSPPLGKSFFKNLVEQYTNGEVEITVVYDGKRPIATGFCLSYLNFKEICWASTDYEYDRYNVNSCLFWNLIKESISEGLDYFSMGRSTRDSNNHIFKLQWNPIEMPLYFNFSEASTGSIKDLEFLTKIWKYQPLKTSQILGHYVSKYVY
jgi:lipid II:glycine glycyltransferase (peptidoglycan interpeptide bridge formation enzyme)